MARHPYESAQDSAFWSRAVARDFLVQDLLPGDVALLRPGDRVVSAGSCFAANLVPHLEACGIAYVRTERRHPAFNAPPDHFGYDSFSAAYGNIYTARQMAQLLRRASWQWQPAEHVWHGADGAFIDPFRPGLRYPAFSAREFGVLTRQHLERVRAAFAQASVFVFTLGLTEAWVSRLDGAVFPACPGTVAGSFDPARHEFHNFTVAEVVADLHEVAAAARRINPALRMVVSVSPVPLVATATGGHVLTANTYSKSVLRAAIGEVAQGEPDVTYFPAYEIVTGPQAPDSSFAADRRSVSADAVARVMACFFAHCPGIGAAPSSGAGGAHPAWQAISNAIVDADCEEAMSERPR